MVKHKEIEEKNFFSSLNEFPEEKKFKGSNSLKKPAFILKCAGCLKGCHISTTAENACLAY